MPIFIADNIIGVFSLATAKTNLSEDESEEVTALFEAIASNMGLAIERVRIQEKAEQTLTSLIDDSPQMLVVLDESGVIRRVSRFGSKLLGYSADNLVGKPFSTLHPQGARDAVEARIKEWREQTHSHVRVDEVQMLTRDGTLSWVKQSTRVTINPSGHLQIFVSCENIDNLRALNNQLRYQANTDLLTDTPNRAAFREQLQEAINNAANSNSMIAVMFIDLDHFKDINDSLGHDSGDQLLVAVAKKIKHQLRKPDIVSRSGGDEFTVMLHSTPNIDTIAAAAQRICNSLKQPITINKQKVNIACSVGICCYPDHALTVHELIKNADIAMYRAKASGRDNFQFFNQEMSIELNDRLSMESDLRRAIEANELRIVFQPQYDLTSGYVIGAEALVRWQHPTKGLIGPDQFIPLAEDTGVIDDLTRWVLHRALRALKHFQQTHPALRMAVNVSAKEFVHRSDLLTRVDEALSEQQIHSHALEIEITESTLIEKPEDAIDIIHKLSERGISLAIDDFGTGYASFNNLLNLPLQQIKIDRKFVSGVTCDERNKIIIDSMVTIARKMALSCVAEGVETQEQLKALQSMDCQFAQGYLLSHPLNERDFKKIVDKPLISGYLKGS